MKESVKALFQPLSIGGITVKNRFVMPPMVTNFMTLEGTPSRAHVNYIRNRAKGGVGLIIQEAASVSWPEGKIANRQLRVNEPTVVANLFDVTDAAHAFGAKILVQLHHGGFLAHPEYCFGAENVSCSAGNGARELTHDEIKKIIGDFIDSASNAKAARFDGVEIHGSHMYLLNQFLNPAWNRRTDEYGGSRENRFRIVREIVEGIREKCGRPFIIGLRLGAVDFPKGNTVEDAVEFCKMAEACGVDMVNLSIGFYEFAEVVPTQWSDEAPYVYISEAAKKAVNIPVAIVGKLRTPELCAGIIEEGKADLICMGRQLICDPELPNKTMFGKEETIRTCLNCLEGCMERMSFADSSIRCVINPYVGQEDLYNEQNVAAVEPKKVLVVGGGIAGMQYAIIAKKQGHQVILAEKDGELGGQMTLASLTPMKKEVGQALGWFKGEVARLGIEVHLNTTVDMDYVKACVPDRVVLAMGNEFATPPIEGIEHTVRGDKAISREVEIGEGKNVIVIGGGIAGSELAHRIVLEGSKVTVMEILPEICVGATVIHSTILRNYIKEHANVLTSVTITKIVPEGVYYQDVEGREKFVAADCVINCAGQRRVYGPLYNELLAAEYEVYHIGDNGQSNFQNSTREAMQLAYTV